MTHNPLWLAGWRAALEQAAQAVELRKVDIVLRYRPFPHNPEFDNPDAAQKIADLIRSLEPPALESQATLCDECKTPLDAFLICPKCDPAEKVFGLGRPATQEEGDPPAKCGKPAASFIPRALI